MAVTSLQIFAALKVTLTILYSLMAFVALAQLYRLNNSGSLRWTIQKHLHLLITLTCITRIVLFSLPTAAYISMPVYCLFLLDILPTLLYFAVFSLVAINWVEVVISLKNSVRNLHVQFMRINFVINVVLWCIAAFLLALAALLELKYSFLTFWFEGIFIGAIAFASAFTFAYYGLKLRTILQQFPLKVATQFFSRLNTNAIIWTCSFIIHALYILVINMVLRVLRASKSLTFSTFLWIWGAYFVVAELIPQALLLRLISNIPEDAINRRTINSSSAATEIDSSADASVRAKHSADTTANAAPATKTVLDDDDSVLIHKNERENAWWDRNGGEKDDSLLLHTNAHSWLTDDAPYDDGDVDEEEWRERRQLVKDAYAVETGKADPTTMSLAYGNQTSFGESFRSFRHSLRAASAALESASADDSEVEL